MEFLDAFPPELGDLDIESIDVFTIEETLKVMKQYFTHKDAPIPEKVSRPQDGNGAERELKDPSFDFLPISMDIRKSTPDTHSPLSIDGLLERDDVSCVTDISHIQGSDFSNLQANNDLQAEGCLPLLSGEHHNTKLTATSTAFSQLLPKTLIGMKRNLIMDGTTEWNQSTLPAKRRRKSNSTAIAFPMHISYSGQRPHSTSIVSTNEFSAERFHYQMKGPPCSLETESASVDEKSTLNHRHTIQTPLQAMEAFTYHHPKSVYQRNISPEEASYLRTCLPHSQGHLQFANQAQAGQAALTTVLKWDFEPPPNDKTIPQDNTQQAHYVRLLTAAFHDTSSSINQGLGPWQQHWPAFAVGDSHYPPQLIETACWQLVAIAVALHTHGPRAFCIFDNSKMQFIHRSRKQTFATRIDLMCEALRLSKARCETVLKGESLEMFVGTAAQTIAQSRNMKKTNIKRWGDVVEVKRAFAGRAAACVKSGLPVPAQLGAMGPAAERGVGEGEREGRGTSCLGDSAHQSGIVASEGHGFDHVDAGKWVAFQ